MSRAKKFVYHLPYLCVSSFLALFIFLTNSVNAHAENITDPFPFNVYDWRDDNSFYPDDLITAVLAAVVNDSSNTVDIDNCFVVPYICNDNGDNYFYVCSQGHFQSIGNLNIGNSVEFINTGSNYSCVTVVVRYENGSFDSPFVYRWYNSGDTYDCFGSANPIIYGSSQVRLDYPVQCFGEFYDVNDNLVLYNDTPWIDPSASDLEPFLDFTGDVSNTFDDSISDVLNQKNWFTNLSTTIKNAFNTLKGWLFSGFSSLANNIRSFFAPWFTQFQNIFNSIQGNIDDFKDKFNHFFEVLEFCYRLGVVNGEFNLGEFLSALFVPSTSDIDNAFTGHSVNTLYHGTVTASKTYYNFFTTVFSGNYVYIYSLPNFTFGGKNFQGLEVNFSWFLQYKSYCDLIVSAFLIIGYIRFLLYFVNNFFYGSGFIDHDLNAIGGEKGIDYTIPY